MSVLLPICAGLLAAAATLAGGWFVVRRDRSLRVLAYFVALGAGFMLAAVFLEVIPEAVEKAGSNAWLLILLGYLLVHFFEHTLAPHLHFSEETHAEEVAHHFAGHFAVLGMSIHALFDGVAIGSGFLVSDYLGGVIFLAVVLHKLPEGFTVASLLLAAGHSRRGAFAGAATLAGATLAGVALMRLLPGQVGAALAFSGGVTLYVAATDLLPEANQHRFPRMALVVFAGVALMVVLRILWRG
jgi:ZIP family zinc transporter/zinc and cadmium transporter